MPKKPKHTNIHLTATDVEAILCVLPLLDCIEADTPAQQDLNYAAAESASQKLLSRGKQLDANELRVIAASLSLALAYLSNQMPELDPFVDPDHRAELQRYFFVINRLEPIFADIIAPLL